MAAPDRPLHQVRALVAAVLALLVFTAADAQACHGPEDSGIRWLRAAEDDWPAHKPWCAGIGEPVYRQVAPESTEVGQWLPILVWNAKAGSGELERLLSALRAGELTGEKSPAHFVVLLQEAVRVDGTVPEPMPAGAYSALTAGPPAGAEQSVEAVAERMGLSLLYVPSMRNGADLGQDRGNAILSTLPLEEPTAIELPLARQRRVAVAARVAFRARGKPMSFLFVSAHLDNGSSIWSFWRSMGAARVYQASPLLELARREEAIVLGADLNTWFGGVNEEVVTLLRDELEGPVELPEGLTYDPPFWLPQRTVDYLLMRLPKGWSGSYEVSEERWGSDHSPLIGWIEP